MEIKATLGYRGMRQSQQAVMAVQVKSDHDRFSAVSHFSRFVA